nr:MAG TPA: glutaredoxin-like protein [Caudoviricetes sp.]
MVTVYSKPKCVQCEMTKEFLKANNVKFEEVNVFEDEEALELIQLHGFQRLPVVTRNNSFDFAFSGFQIDLLDELVEK